MLGPGGKAHLQLGEIETLAGEYQFGTVHGRFLLQHVDAHVDVEPGRTFNAAKGQWVQRVVGNDELGDSYTIGIAAENLVESAVEHQAACSSNSTVAWKAPLM